PIERYGVARFARDFAAAGGGGLINPDLIPEEAEPWLAASDETGLGRGFLVAPSPTQRRIAMTGGARPGFLYRPRVMGVTGARDAVAGSAPDLVARVREATDLPIGVGLGVRDGAQAAAVAGYADGVIVGSALVRCVLDAPDAAAGEASLRALV